jgi:hypothetical protein
MNSVRQEDLFRYDVGRDYVHQVLGDGGWESSFIHNEYLSYAGRYAYAHIGTLEEATKEFVKRSDQNISQRICRISRYLTAEEGIPVIQEVVRYSRKNP